MMLNVGLHHQGAESLVDALAGREDRGEDEAVRGCASFEVVGEYLDASGTVRSGGHTQRGSTVSLMDGL